MAKLWNSQFRMPIRQFSMSGTCTWFLNFTIWTSLFCQNSRNPMRKTVFETLLRSKILTSLSFQSSDVKCLLSTMEAPSKHVLNAFYTNMTDSWTTSKSLTKTQEYIWFLPHRNESKKVYFRPEAKHLNANLDCHHVKQIWVVWKKATFGYPPNHKSGKPGERSKQTKQTKGNSNPACTIPSFSDRIVFFFSSRFLSLGLGPEKHWEKSIVIELMFYSVANHAPQTSRISFWSRHLDTLSM